MKIKFDINTSIAYASALFSGIAAIGGLWAAVETGAQARIANEEAAIDRQAALVRSCAIVSSERFATGDTEFIIHGRRGYATEQSDLDVSAFKATTSAKRLLRCSFTNYSRVPLLNVEVKAKVVFTNHDKIPNVSPGPMEFEWDTQPVPALAPSQTQNLWFVNDESSPADVYEITEARYERFPLLGEVQSQKFSAPTMESALECGCWTVTNNNDVFWKLNTPTGRL